MYLDRLEYKHDLLVSIDGRCRFLSAAFFIASVVYSTKTLTLSLVIVSCLIVLSRGLRVTLLRLIPVNMMTAAVWIPVLFGFNAASALLYTLRVNAAALLYMCFIIPMSISALSSSMTKLYIPEKLVALFILTYRYIFLMYQGLSTALVSMRLRSVRNSTVYRWRSLAAVFAATLTSAVFRAGRISRAMTARGFDGAFPVTAVFKWKLRDSVLLVLCVFTALCIGVLWNN
jgi:cobalt/nickel transport system permease protein